MYQKIIAITVSILVLINCGNVSNQNEFHAETTPETLQETNNYSWSKRGYYDIIQSLFTEARENNASLEKLMLQVEEHNQDKNAVLSEFNNFDSKNQNYYNAALGLIQQISDSTVKEQLTISSNKLSEEYRSFKKEHENLITAIDEAEDMLQDKLIIMKLAITQKMMNTFQENEIPKLKEMEDIMARYSELVTLIEKVK